MNYVNFYGHIFKYISPKQEDDHLNYKRPSLKTTIWI